VTITQTNKFEDEVNNVAFICYSCGTGLDRGSVCVPRIYIISGSYIGVGLIRIVSRHKGSSNEIDIIKTHII
jgi:hypothetical protein